MPFQISGTITCYLLPEDGAAAEAALLQHLEDDGEMYITAYAFTLGPMIDRILADFQAGDPLHIYLDASQSRGAAERVQVQRLVDAGVEVTIGTSPEGSRYICHTKGIVCIHDEGPDEPDTAFCWEGSVNFSESGWHQVNTAMVFGSSGWSTEFVKHFKGLRQFAWTNERPLQLMTAPPAGVQ